MLALTFTDKADYDKIRERDLISVMGLKDFASGRTLKVVLHLSLIHIATDGPCLLEACVEEEGNVMPMTPPGGAVNQMLLEC